jgi:transposase-like protein
MKITCQRCGNKEVKKYGKDKRGAQRYKCLNCAYVYKRKSPRNKFSNERVWFKWWVDEGLSIRQMSLISKHSASKIKRLKNKCL